MSFHCALCSSEGPAEDVFCDFAAVGGPSVCRSEPVATPAVSQASLILSLCASSREHGASLLALPCVLFFPEDALLALSLIPCPFLCFLLHSYVLVQNPESCSKAPASPLPPTHTLSTCVSPPDSLSLASLPTFPNPQTLKPSPVPLLLWKPSTRQTTTRNNLFLWKHSDID